MARIKGAKEIPPEVEDIIIKFKGIFPDHKPRQLLADIERNKIFLKLTKYRKPSIRKVQEILTENKDEIIKLIEDRKKRKPSILDKPFSLGVLAQHNQYFIPESITTLYEIEKEVGLNLKEAQMVVTDSKPTELHKNKGDRLPENISFLNNLTLRQVIWFFRLKPLIEKIYSEELRGINKKGEKFEFIFEISHVYSFAEQFKENMNQDVFDTSDLDALLFSGNYEEFYKFGFKKRRKERVE
jgi:hypothetical protein